MVTETPVRNEERPSDNLCVLLDDVDGVGAEHEVEVEDAAQSAERQRGGRLQNNL